MKIIRKLILFSVIGCFILSSATVCTAEVEDSMGYDDYYAYWDSFDWENTDLDSIEFYPWDFAKKDALRDWLKTNGDISLVFHFAQVFRGSALESNDDMLCIRFMQTPLTFVRVLATLDVETQMNIAERLVRQSYLWGVGEGFYPVPGLIMSLNPDDLELQEEKAVLELMKDNVVKYWGDEIPKTGDPVVFIAAAMVLSGTAGATLLLKKKKVRGDR